MNFTEAEYIAQGLYPPCPRARYIPTSSPFTAGDVWICDDYPLDPYVAWEQHCMGTGGVWITRLWWVPSSELPIQPLP